MKRKREKPESAPKGRNARRVFFYFLKGCKRMLVAAVLVSVVESALAFITPLILQLVMDGVLGDAAYPVWFSWLPGAAVLRAKLPYIALVIVGFTLTNAVVSYIARRLTKRTAEAFGRNIRNRLFAHIQSLPFSWHSDVTTGDIIQRSTADVDLVKRFIDEQLIELLSTVTRVGVGFSLMFMLSTVSGAVGIVVIPLIVGVSLLFFRRVGKLFQVADEADGAVSTALQENLTGLRVVRAFGAQRYEVDRFEQKTGDVVTLWRNLSWRLGLFWGTGDLIAGTQIMALMVSGAYLAAAGSMTLGVLLAVLMIAQMTIWPVRHFGRILGEASKTGISLKRLYEVIAAAPEPKGGLTPVITGDVEFRNVSFAYKDGRKVLDDISFTLKAGQTLGIVGGTGSGKSTLAALLTRLYDPTEGVILLNGVPTTDIDRQYLRANVGIVLQEPFLFSRTVRDNLVIARETAAARMEDMARVACADEAVAEFDKGYDTMVGERGVTVSGGQKQRIAVARTLLGGAPVLIFDDSLSAVDTQTDAKIRKGLSEHLKGTTVILISHRLTTVMRADQIAVLENGKLSQKGTHKELTAQEGIYKEIFALQVAEGITN